LAREIILRRGTLEDLEGIAAVQRESPEASQWNVRDYLECDLLVAVEGRQVAGFLVTRTVAGESEVLNLAVRPAWRRLGIARALFQEFRKCHLGEVYLEVRQGNRAARILYYSLSFQDVGRRTEYYKNPTEDAVVMRLRSC
jgi:ribosomal-protein-alanine N-acetyltransferase